MEPKIRFKGFEGEWKTPSIGDVFELRNGYTPSKIVKEFWEGGTIPWFRMEDIRINGGFLKDALQHITPLAVKGAGLFEKNSIILATTATIGVHAMLIADSLANQQFTNFKVRKSLSDEYIDEFIYYSFFKIDEWSKNNTNSGGLLSVNMPLLVKQGFLTPCKEEQQTIASYFRILDAKLQASTKKVESLKKLKSASLVAMFPQNGESMPKVRFKGFEGEWKETTLSECLDISYLQNSENKYDKNDVLSVSDDFGVMNQIELLGRSYAGKDVSSYSILQKGEIVYTKSPLKDKPFGIIKKNSYQTGIVSILYAVYHSKDNISADYIHYYFDPAWRLNAYMRPLVNKGAKNTMNISDEMALMGSLILPPSLAEQQAIATFFRSLDRKIALETARLEKLKQIKLACLDKMFV